MRGLPQKQNARRADKIRLCGHLGRYKKILKKTYIIYYNFYAKKTWADKASYDMLIDSSRISEKELAAMLRALLTARGVELETDGSDQ